MIMGLQHCFAMIGGLITPPLVVMRFTVCGFPFCAEKEQYAISAALITSGICTIINVMQIPIPFSESIRGKTLYIGSGVLSVLGTSFTFLPIYEIAISQMKADGMTGDAAYGAMIGTSMVCCLLELVLSFVPMRAIKKVFPPIVTSITVILIGITLTGAGMKYWGGGVVCAEMGWQTHAKVVSQELSFGPPFPSCANGETSFFYGDYRYIGLGFTVLSFLVVIELFGSIFMKNCNVILALLFGYLIAGISKENYVDPDNIALAPGITFLWVETFPISFYAPAVIPLLIAYLVTTVETVGDITGKQISLL
jgi:NCS2 family nucleobase:cation symporter-2